MAIKPPTVIPIALAVAPSFLFWCVFLWHAACYLFN